MFRYYSSVPSDGLLMATGPHRASLAVCNIYVEEPIIINFGKQITYSEQILDIELTEENIILNPPSKLDL